MEVRITNDNFATEVLASDRPVLVDFSATWCGPCQLLAPIVAEIAREQAEVLKVGKLDVDEAPELAARYGIASIPALLLFKRGEVVATTVGYRSKAELAALLAPHL
ncbi:MAG: thioredoxin [Kiritimatiellia bacterium]